MKYRRSFFFTLFLSGTCWKIIFCALPFAFFFCVETHNLDVTKHFDQFFFLLVPSSINSWAFLKNLSRSREFVRRETIASFVCVFVSVSLEINVELCVLIVVTSVNLQLDRCHGFTYFFFVVGWHFFKARIWSVVDRDCCDKETDGCCCWTIKWMAF